MHSPNKLNIAKWVVALRSGLYKQTQSALRNEVRGLAYCCLGVACEISKLGQWGTGSCYSTAQDSSVEHLPAGVTDWLGLDANPLVTEGRDAIDANDLHGMSFKEIADGLEKLYLGGEKAEDIVRIAQAEPEAWRILAEELDKGAGRISSFLCIVLKYDFWSCPRVISIPADVRGAMVKRIESALDGTGAAYGDTAEDKDMTEAEMREGRVLACLMFAEQAADEVGAA